MLNQAVQDEKKILLCARKKLGMTQQQVAAKAHITVRHFQMFESGERKVSNASFRTARNVLETLGIDLYAFAHGEYARSEQKPGSIDNE